MDIKKAIQLAISNTFQEGLTDIFPRPFEVDLLKDVAFKNKAVSYTHLTLPTICSV